MDRLFRAKIVAPISASLVVIGFLAWSVAPTLKDRPDPQSTRVLARDGSLLYEASASGEEKVAPVPLAEMPPLLVEAVVAAEDKRFYVHPGFDPLAFAQAMSDDLRARSVVRGGSTIEAQLMKNLFFPSAPRTALQKARETAAALRWGMTHSKQATLERYLATVYLGGREYGMPAAARDYFHKDVRDLSLPEAAMLAGMIGAPSRYEPVGHLSAAKARQAFVLDRLAAEGKITSAQAKEAKATAITVFPQNHAIKGPHFVMRVLDGLEGSIPDIRAGGYEITTTLDPDASAWPRTRSRAISSRSRRST